MSNRVTFSNPVFFSYNKLVRLIVGGIPIPMLQKNIYLLKEFIKTLIATEVVFPGVLPRGLGHDFSQPEHEAIYFALKFIIQKAHPLQDRDMIDALERIDDPVTEIHWFLSDYWRDIVALLEQYSDLTGDYLSHLN